MTDDVRERLVGSMLPEVQNQIDTDQELIRQAQKGSAESLEKLVRRHHLDLRQYLVRRTGNLSLADDLAQDVLMAAVNQLGTLKQTTSFRSWLLTIARNKVVDFLRNISRERKNNQQMAEFMMTRQSVARIHRTAPSESPEIREALSQCISGLAPHAQQLVNAFYFESRSAESIANEQSKKSNSVRMSLMRIRKSLAQCIRQRTGMEL